VIHMLLLIVVIKQLDNISLKLYIGFVLISGQLFREPPPDEIYWAAQARQGWMRCPERILAERNIKDGSYEQDYWN
jgi:hypothetical protein